VSEPTSRLKERLLGRWYGKSDGQPMALEFRPDGKLAVVFLEGDRQQIIRLTYQVDGEYVVTDQPSHSRPERSKAEFKGEDLILDFQGVRTRLSWAK
jgi:hypothetical protein